MKGAPLVVYRHPDGVLRLHHVPGAVNVAAEIMPGYRIATGFYDNTLFVFSSEPGSTGMNLERALHVGGIRLLPVTEAQASSAWTCDREGCDQPGACEICEACAVHCAAIPNALETHTMDNVFESTDRLKRPS